MPLDLDLPLREGRYAVVDIETTGLKPPFARITEIAAVRICDGEIDLELAQLIDPGCAIPPRITEMTGISNQMVMGQPDIDTVWPFFLRFVGDAVVIAHNARFDLSFLDQEAWSRSGEPLPNPELCTVTLARRAWPWLGRHNLDAVAEHCGIAFDSRHRALGDAKVTAQVFLELIPYLERMGLLTVGQVLRAQRSARCQARLAAAGRELSRR